MRRGAPHEALIFFGYFLVSRQESNRGRGQSPKQNNYEIKLRITNYELRITNYELKRFCNILFDSTHYLQQDCIAYTVLWGVFCFYSKINFYYSTKYVYAALIVDYGNIFFNIGHKQRY